MKLTSKTLKTFTLVLALLAMGCVPSFGRDKNETIDATAYGTSTQLGRNVGVTVIIYEFSTPEDRQILVDAFQQGQNQGLVNALQKMKAVGRIQIPGTLGYDLSFIRLIQSPTGRTIRFVTNRKIAFGEAYYNTPSHSRSTSPPARFSLTTRTKARVQGFCTLRASSLSTRTASCRSS